MEKEESNKYETLKLGIWKTFQSSQQKTSFE